MITFLKDPIQYLLADAQSWEPQKLEQEEISFHMLELGVLRISPKQASGHALALSCGIHGNETAPIEIVSDLIKEIAQGSLLPRLELLIQFGNIEAMKKQERFVDFNLNRLFSDTYSQHSETLESKRAETLQNSLADFYTELKKMTEKLWHFDLHTAIRGSYHQKFAIRPFCDSSHYPEITKEEISLLKALDLGVVVQSNSKNTTYSSHSANRYGALSFTMELGKVRPFGENDREDFQGTYDGIKTFIETGLPPEASSPGKPLIHYKVVEELLRSDESTELHLSDDYENFTPIEREQPIQTTNGITRNARNGESVIFPNKKVKLGQRTGLIIAPSGTL